MKKLFPVLMIFLFMFSVVGAVDEGYMSPVTKSYTIDNTPSEPQSLFSQVFGNLFSFVPQQTCLSRTGFRATVSDGFASSGNHVTGYGNSCAVGERVQIVVCDKSGDSSNNHCTTPFDQDWLKTSSSDVFPIVGSSKNCNGNCYEQSWYQNKIDAKYVGYNCLYCGSIDQVSNECDSDSDCVAQGEEWIGNEYCSGSDTWQTKLVPVCSQGVCGEKSVNRLKERNSNSCSDYEEIIITTTTTQSTTTTTQSEGEIVSCMTIEGNCYSPISNSCQEGESSYDSVQACESVQYGGQICCRSKLTVKGYLEENTNIEGTTILVKTLAFPLNFIKKLPLLNQFFLEKNPITLSEKIVDGFNSFPDEYYYYVRDSCQQDEIKVDMGLSQCNNKNDVTEAEVDNILVELNNEIDTISNTTIKNVFENNIVLPSDKKPLLDLEKVSDDFYTKTMYKDSKCKLDTECQEPGVCLPFSQFPKNVDDKFGLIPPQGFCVDTDTEFTTFNLAETLKGLWDTDDENKAYLYTGGVIILLFLLMSMGRRKN